MKSKLVVPNLSKRLDFSFEKKPLLIGGLAMEYYGLRKAGEDVDFVLSQPDHRRLKDKLDEEGMKYLKDKHKSGYKEVPEFVNLYGDKGILIYELELWTCILRFDYSYLSDGALEKEHYRVISLEKLLFLKALATDKPKCLRDVKLIAQKIIDGQYKAKPQSSQSFPHS